jgi:hypothetical protein
MTLLFAFLSILWWIAMWGLIDLGMHTWTNKEKAITYGAMLLFVGGVITVYPEAIGRL